MNRSHLPGLAALALGLLLAAAPAAGEELSADAWHDRISDALRVRAPMTARGRMLVQRPGEKDWGFSLEMLRAPHRGGVRTVFEMREDGDAQAVVSELVVLPDEPMVNWYWDVQKRRWLSVRGLLATDPFAETLFRFEDLWLTDPAARRSGSVASVEEDGRRLTELHSGPYHYYQRVETRLDPESGLPVRIRFVDNTGTPIREEVFEEVRLVDGRPFPTVVRLRDLVSGAQSTLTFDEVRFVERIPPSFFDLSVIDDRIRKGADPVPVDLPDVGPGRARQEGI